MAIVAHLIERDIDPGDFVIDGVAAVVLAIDDAVDTTDALVRARARTVLNAAGFQLPAGYFTSNTAIAAVYDAAGDVTVFNGRNVYEEIA
jgi:hypothetical protein